MKPLNLILLQLFCNDLHTKIVNTSRMIENKLIRHICGFMSNFIRQKATFRYIHQTCIVVTENYWLFYAHRICYGCMRRPELHDAEFFGWMFVCLLFVMSVCLLFVCGDVIVVVCLFLFLSNWNRGEISQFDGVSHGVKFTFY